MKTLADYRVLPFTRRVELVTEEDGTYFAAFVEEIPWIRAYGDTPVEAYHGLAESFEDALQAMIDAGDEIPEPKGAPEKWGSPPDRERWKSRRDEVAYVPVVVPGLEDEPADTRISRSEDVVLTA